MIAIPHNIVFLAKRHQTKAIRVRYKRFTEGQGWLEAKNGTGWTGKETVRMNGNEILSGASPGTKNKVTSVAALAKAVFTKRLLWPLGEKLWQTPNDLGDALVTQQIDFSCYGGKMCHADTS